MFNVNKIRHDFPMFDHIDPQKPLVYFDNAATTFKPRCVVDAVVKYYTTSSVNIHRGDYDLSYQVSDEYEKTRKLTPEIKKAIENAIAEADKGPSPKIPGLETRMKTLEADLKKVLPDDVKEKIDKAVEATNEKTTMMITSLDWV